MYIEKMTESVKPNPEVWEYGNTTIKIRYLALCAISSMSRACGLTSKWSIFHNSFLNRNCNEAFSIICLTHVKSTVIAIAATAAQTGVTV